MKNLAKSTTEKQLKEVFGKTGEVTDVRIMKTATGASRGFGFIGFRSHQQALESVNYFNNTFINSSKITVELAKKVGDTDLVAKSKKSKAKATAERLGDGKKAATVKWP